MHILPVYAALLGILFFYLSVRTIGLRRKLQIGIGASDSPEMLRAMRVHANFAEYAPLALLLIYLTEQQAAPALLVHALGLCLLIGRSLHAWGVSQVQERFVFRVTGMAMTFTAMLTSCAWLLYKAAAA
ncbi:MAG: hypothetical protein RI920_36 [Pseudomonadota bacterium]|jgi:uncharacterized membrane protein YecN with MAPEG domain